METSVRRLTRAEVNYTQEAWSIQNTALAGGCRVVKLNQIVFFATETGDAWMLDPADALAACLARGHVNRPLPIWETGTKLRVPKASLCVVERCKTAAQRRQSSVIQPARSNE